VARKLFTWTWQHAPRPATGRPAQAELNATTKTVEVRLVDDDHDKPETLEATVPGTDITVADTDVGRLKAAVFERLAQLYPIAWAPEHAAVIDLDGGDQPAAADTRLTGTTSTGVAVHRKSPAGTVYLGAGPAVGGRKVAEDPGRYQLVPAVSAEDAAATARLINHLGRRAARRWARRLARAYAQGPRAVDKFVEGEAKLDTAEGLPAATADELTYALSGKTPDGRTPIRL
jgi:hypothetical protein